MKNVRYFMILKTVFMCTFTWALVSVSCGTTSAFASEKPVILWVSSPVEEGETVLVHGGGLVNAESETSGTAAETSEKVGTAGGADAAGTTVEIRNLRSGETKTVAPDYASETCVMFRNPFGEPSEFVVKTGAGTSEKYALNVPVVWWIQGDSGRSATVGGWIAVEGNNVSNENTFELISVRDSSAKKSVLVKNFEKLPESVTPGMNFVRIGEEIVGEINVAEAQEFYKPDRFDVTDFGAVPNDGIDDTSAFLTAAEKLRENGGGILYVPHGRFQMRDILELPPHSALLGEPIEKERAGSANGNGPDDSVQIYWPDTYEPTECLVHGTHDFAVENVFLTCGNHRDGISNAPLKSRPAAEAQNSSEKSNSGEKSNAAPDVPQNIRIRNVRIRMVYSEFINDAPDELVRRLPPLHYVRALRLAGENVTIENNDIYCAAGGVFELKCYWSVVRNNQFSRGNICGWNGFGGQQLLFCSNYFGGASTTSFYGLPEGSENVLWEENTHENDFDGNNRETITGDGRVHGYIDRAENITPTSFTLRREINSEKGAPLVGPNVLERGVETWFRPENELQRNGAVQLAGGKGVGQIRRIRTIQALEDGTIRVELDRPWDVLPDEETIFSITSFRRHFIYRRNTASDSTTALQFYGSMLESLIMQNCSSRTGGFNGDAMTGESNWFNQFLNNNLWSGNAYRGPRNESPATDAQLGLLAYGNGTKNYQYPLVRACIVRNNTLQKCARINIMGNVAESVVEQNQISNSDCGIVVAPGAKGILLSENTFSEVKKPYTMKKESVVIAPFDAFRSELSGLDEKFQEWVESNPSLQELGLPQTEEEVEKFRETLLQQAFQAGFLKNLTPLQAEALTGVTLTTPNWGTTVDALQHGTVGPTPLYIQIENPKVRATLKMQVKPENFTAEGWNFTFPELALEPGKTTAQNLRFTKPEGPAPLLQLPITAELTGDGWTLEFTQTLSDPWGSLPLERWKLSAPFTNPAPQKVLSGIQYTPYENLSKPDESELVAQIFPNGQLDLKQLNVQKSLPETEEGSVIYAVSTLTAAEEKEVSVRLEGWTRGALVFVNGKIVGTNQPHGQWGFATLQPGVNRVEIWIYATQKNSFKFTAPRITWTSAQLGIMHE